MLMIRGNLLIRSKKKPEVVVRALGLQLERQLGVERLLLRRLRREPLDRQVRLRRQPLDAAQDVGDVLLLGQHLLERVEPMLEVGDLRLEFRQPPRRRDALGDVGPSAVSRVCRAAISDCTSVT